MERRPPQTFHFARLAARITTIFAIIVELPLAYLYQELQKRNYCAQAIIARIWYRASRRRGATLNPSTTW